MYVRDYMTKNVLTVPSDMLIHDAEQLMKQNNIHRLPVVDNGKLVGIVTRTRLREVAPSPATSLSVWELNYILAKMKVSDAMTRNVVTVTPETTMEDAALLGNKQGVGALPVVEGGRIVGIVTQTDMFRVFVEVLGTRETGTRLHIHEHGDKEHMVGEIASVINKHGGRIHSIVRIHAPGRPHPDVVVRLAGRDSADEAIEELSKLGYKVEID